MAKPNYSFVKRQRELEKKQKKEEKRKQKAGAQEAVAQEIIDKTAPESPSEDAAVTDSGLKSEA
jgi:hypothetical protein